MVSQNGPSKRALQKSSPIELSERALQKSSLQEVPNELSKLRPG